ncbi:MAG: cell division protein SepF [archaeon]
MRERLLKLRDKIIGSTNDYPDEFGEDYLEIDTNQTKEQPKQKIVVKPFVINEFSDVKAPLEALREGYTIALINIGPIRNEDLIELKRVVNKLRKTCEAIEGDIAGFDENWLIVTPSFAQIHRNAAVQTDAL